MATQKAAQPIPILPGKTLPAAEQDGGTCAFNHLTAVATVAACGLAAAVLLVELDRHEATVLVTVLSIVTTIVSLHFELMQDMLDFLSSNAAKFSVFCRDNKETAEVRFLGAALTVVLLVVLVAVVVPT